MAGKVSKKDAGYGPGMPHCGVCTHFIDNDDNVDAGEDYEDGECELVVGKIGEDMWCKLFREKRRKTLAEGGG